MGADDLRVLAITGEGHVPVAGPRHGRVPLASPKSAGVSWATARAGVPSAGVPLATAKEEAAPEKPTERERRAKEQIILHGALCYWTLPQ